MNRKLQAFATQLKTPSGTLRVALANHRAGERVFVADMVVRRRPIPRGQMIRPWVRFPWRTAQVALSSLLKCFASDGTGISP
jgi:DUF1365 family protein